MAGIWFIIGFLNAVIVGSYLKKRGWNKTNEFLGVMSAIVFIYVVYSAIMVLIDRWS